MQTLTQKENAVAIEFPSTWDPASLTDVKLHIIAPSDGEVLESDIETSLYTPTTLASTAGRYTQSLVLTAGAAALEIDDPIRIVGAAGREDHRVEGYDASTRTVTLTKPVDRGFEIGSTVYRLSAKAVIDLADTETYPAGLRAILKWVPEGSGAPYTEVIEVEGFDQSHLSGLRADLEAFYPRTFDALTIPEDRLPRFERAAIEELRLELQTRGLDISRVRDQSILLPVVSALIAYRQVRPGDFRTAEERRELGIDYAQALKRLCKHPIWQDADGDLTEDIDETTSRRLIFKRSWR